MNAESTENQPILRYRVLRWLRRALLAFLCLALLVALFYAEENWRGKRAWENYKSQAEIMGERFDWSVIAPRSVPEAENVAALPIFSELFSNRPGQPRADRLQTPDCKLGRGNWHEQRREDLDAWLTCFANKELQAALKQYNASLGEITEACQRPYARFPLRYEDGFELQLPHLNTLRQAGLLYRLRALNALKAGDARSAFDDVLACLRLGDSIQNEPLNISLLVRIRVLDDAIQILWEGLAAHRWEDDQLIELQKRFGTVDLLRQHQNTLEGERLNMLDAYRQMRERTTPLGVQFSEIYFASDDLRSMYYHLLTRVAPAGWSYHSQIWIDQFYSQTLSRIVKPLDQRIDVNQFRRAQQMVQPFLRDPKPWKVVLSPMESIYTKFACAQTSVQQATLACALERYRLAHGKHPEKLDTLVPQFVAKIPHDVIDGRPLRYSRMGANAFLLYSIGWNEIDDGGQIAMTKDAPGQRVPSQDIEQGDWVWRYP